MGHSYRTNVEDEGEMRRLLEKQPIKIISLLDQELDRYYNFQKLRLKISGMNYSQIYFNFRENNY